MTTATREELDKVRDQVIVLDKTVVRNEGRLDRAEIDVAANTIEIRGIGETVMSFKHALEGATGTFNEGMEEMRADRIAKANAKAAEELANAGWWKDWRAVFQAKNAGAILVIVAALSMLINSFRHDEPIDQAELLNAIRASQTIPVDSPPEVPR